MFFYNCFQPQTHRWCVKKQLKKWAVNYTDIECFAFNPICEIYFFWEKYKKSVHLWLINNALRIIKITFRSGKLSNYSLTLISRFTAKIAFASKKKKIANFKTIVFKFG